MSVHNKASTYSVAVLAGLIASPLPVMGQTLEEVVVTAQRREQNVLEVPVSLDVLSERDLQGISDVRDLYKVTPTFQFQGGVSSGGQSLSIRGVGGGGFASSFEHSVSVIVDQIATGPSGSALGDFWDVQRIEVLNGPQGTLFGKNVTAGLVNVVTNDPTDEFEGMTAVSYESEYEALRLDAVLSGPIPDNWTARLAIFSKNQGEGLVENPPVGTTQNNKEPLGIRLKTAYETDSFEFNMALTYEKQDGVCCARIFTGIEPQALGVFAPIAFGQIQANGLTISQDAEITIGEGPVFDDIETLNGAFELIWELDNGHSIKSITGIRDWEQSDFNDVDAVDLNIIDGGLTHDMTFFSEELQLISPTGGALEYIVGLYYLNYDIEETTRLEGTLLGGGTLQQDDWRTDVELENIAIFGHATYKFSEQWAGFVGARLLREEQYVNGKRDGNFLFPGDQPFTEGSIDDTDWMGTIGLQYFPSDTSMFYGSYSRGYKGGSIGNTIGSVLFLGDAISPIIDPETVDSFELGAKMSALDNRVTVSATVYLSKFDDFQSSSFVTQSNSFVFTNAGELSTRGLEFNVDGNLWEGGSLNLALAYVDAKFDVFTGAPCTVPDTAAGTCSGAVPGTSDLSGENVNNSPKVRYVIGAQQDFMIGGSNAYFRAEYMWRDDVIFDGDLDPNTAIDAYGLLSARFGVEVRDNIEVALWGRNLTDEYYWLRIIDAPVESGLYSGHPAPGREIGADVMVRF